MFIIVIKTDCLKIGVKLTVVLSIKKRKKTQQIDIVNVILNMHEQIIGNFESYSHPKCVLRKRAI